MINTENFYSSYYKDTTKDKALPTASRIRFENGVVENVLLEDKGKHSANPVFPPLKVLPSFA